MREEGGWTGRALSNTRKCLIPPTTAVLLGAPKVVFTLEFPEE